MAQKDTRSAPKRKRSSLYAEIRRTRVSARLIAKQFARATVCFINCFRRFRALTVSRKRAARATGPLPRTEKFIHVRFPRFKIAPCPPSNLTPEGKNLEKNRIPRF